MNSQLTDHAAPPASPLNSGAPCLWAAQIALALLYGVSAGLVAFYPVRVSDLPGAIQAVLLLGIGAACAAAAWWGIFRFAARRLAHHGVGQRAGVLLFTGMLLAGVYLAVAYPVTPILPGKQELRITATGAKNALSGGSEVALARLYGWNNTLEDLSRFQASQSQGGWQMLDGNLVAGQVFPARLTWRSKWLHPVSLVFVAGASGGVAEVEWNGQTRRVDLYSPIYFLKEVAFYPDFPRFYAPLYLLAWGSLIGLLLYLALAALLRPAPDAPFAAPQSAGGGAAALIGILPYTLALIAIWGVGWLALYPGLLSPDTRSQLRQIASGVYNNWHPVFHTWTMALIFRVWNSPAAVSLVQIVLMAGAAGLAYHRMARAGVSRWWRLAGLATFGLSIVNALLVITLWKDILFTVAFIIFFVYTVDLVERRGEGRRPALYWVGFFVAALLTALYRHNGATIVPITLACLLIGFKALRRRLLVFLLAFVALVLALKGPFIRFLHIENSMDASLPTMFGVYHIAAHVVAGNEFSPDDQAYLNRILPYDGDWNISCYHPDSLLYRQRYHPEAAAANPEKLRQIFFQTLGRNPLVNLKFIVCSGSLIWRISQTTQFNGAALLPGVPPDSKLPQVVPLIDAIYRRSTGPMPAAPVWRPAVYLYLFLFGVLVKSLNGGRRFLLLAAPVLGLCLPLALVITNQDFRFLYPVAAVTLLYWPYLLLSPKMSE